MSIGMWRRATAALLAMLAVAVSVRAQEPTVRDGPPEGGHDAVPAEWATLPAEWTTVQNEWATPPAQWVTAVVPVAALPAIAAPSAVEPVPPVPAIAPVAREGLPLAAVPAQATTPPPPPAAPPQGPSREDEDSPGRQPPPPPPAAPTRPPRTQVRPAIAAEPPRAVVEPQYVSKGVNIRIDATVTESRGDQTLGRKVVSITLVDGDSGSVRSSALVPVGTANDFARVPLNMDARGRIRDDNRVQAQVTLDYNRGSVELGESGTPTRAARDSGIRQSVSVILVNGTPLVVAQSADPEGDRRVTLELKATILK